MVDLVPPWAGKVNYIAGLLQKENYHAMEHFIQVSWAEVSKFCPLTSTASTDMVANCCWINTKTEKMMTITGIATSPIVLWEFMSGFTNSLC